MKKRQRLIDVLYHSDQAHMMEETNEISKLEAGKDIQYD